jgi:hypothetical protein
VNLLRVGESAEGTLEIRDGAKVEFDGNPKEVFVGPGSILVTGASGATPSLLTTDELDIGSPVGAGSMTVEAGGRVILQDRLTIGIHSAPGTVTVQTGGRIEANQLELGSDFQPLGQTELSLLSVTGQPADDPAALIVHDAARLGGANSQLTLSAGGQANFDNGLELSPTGRTVLGAIDPGTFATVSGLMKVAGKSASASASVVVQNGAAVSRASGESANLQVGDPGAGGAGDIQISHPSSGAADPITAQMVFDNINLLLGRISVDGAGILRATDHLNLLGRRTECDLRRGGFHERAMRYAGDRRRADTGDCLDSKRWTDRRDQPADRQRRSDRWFGSILSIDCV